MLTRDLTAAKRSVATSGAMAEFALVFALGAQKPNMKGVYGRGGWDRARGPRASQKSES
jgi:hypothetical protein